MTQRLLSLDAFRGFTIAAMLLVNNPGNWSAIYGPLGHATWHGWTFTDWIFPFFIFISGISMTLSLGARAAAGSSRTKLLAQTARRAAIIFAIGLALNLIPAFNLSELRIPGVLQRLALCTLFAAPIMLWWHWRGQLVWALGLLALYSLIQLGLPVPDAAGVWHQGTLQPGEDAGAWLDRWLLDGHLWHSSRTWDPEGLLSTLPAVASQLAGVLAGHWLKTSRDAGEKTIWLMLCGLACLWLGELLDAWLMPINKNLWTPSYAVAMTGWACVVFSVFYWLLDAMPLPLLRARMARWALPLQVFGVNALFLFAFSGLLARMLGFIKVGPASLKAWLYAPIEALPIAPVNASLLYAIGFVAAMSLLAWALWHKRWLIKV